MKPVCFSGTEMPVFVLAMQCALGQTLSQFPSHGGDGGAVTHQSTFGTADLAGESIIS